MSIATKKIEKDEKIELLKATVCKGASDDEFKLFLMVCERTGLDPFARQIYSIPRGEGRTIQTSIDGFRLIAERTGKYSPGREPTYQYDDEDRLVSATSYIKKQTPDGTWHEVSATAHYEEFAQMYPNRQTGKSEPSKFWKQMPHVMLAKCAEAQALRRAFPSEMGGVYIKEEMDQAEVAEPEVEEPKVVLTTQQIAELIDLLKSDDEGLEKLNQKYQSYLFIPQDSYSKVIDWLKSRAKKKPVTHQPIEKKKPVTEEIEVFDE